MMLSGFNLGLDLSLAVRGRRGGGAVTPWSPSDLFLGAETGDWWTVADAAVRFQNSNGTTPAATADDPIGYIGGQVNGNHLIQATAGARPLYKTSGGLHWFETDGFDDRLRASFTHTQPLTRVLAYSIITFENNDRVVGAPAGSFLCDLYQITAGGNRLRIYAGGADTIDILAGVDTSSYVVTYICDGASSKGAVNNGSYVAADIGTGTPSGIILGTNNAGANAALIKCFGGIDIGRVLTDEEIALARTYFGSLAGLTL